MARRARRAIHRLLLLTPAACGTSNAGPADSGSRPDAKTMGDADLRADDGSVAADSTADAATPDAGREAAAKAPQTLANVGWGMYNQHGEAAWASDISHAESVTGRHMDIVMDYTNWSSGTAPFPTISSQVITGIGGRPMMWTVQPSG
jgi:hypothetical protein